MRFITFAAFYGVVALGTAGVGAAMSPASGTIELRATATFSDGTSADRLYKVRSDADGDGDGVMDQGWLRVACKQGSMSAVYYAAASPRDSASGMATGKRQHGSVTITKEWGASTPMLGKTGAGGGGGGGVVGSTVSWDLATGKGARTAGAGPTRGDHSGASDDSAGHGAKDKAKPSVATYDLKKLEGARSGQWDQATNKGAHSTGSGQAKTMAHDSWHEATLTEGSPNLCS